MSAGGVMNGVRHNDRTMANGLPSSKRLAQGGWDACCGIHGHARERAGIKHGTVCARRRHDKEVIQEQLKDNEDEYLG